MTAPAKAPPPITIRPYRADDEAGILKTFNLVFRETNGEGYVDRGVQFWRWQYLDNPEGHRISVAVTDDGTVAAHYGGVPYRIATEHGDLTFVHIVDSFVHPGYRAGLKAPGLFVCTALPWFKDCYARGDAVPYGFPVPRAERIGQRYLHYHRLRVVDYLCRDLTLACPSVDAVATERLTTLGPEVDALFANFRKQHQCLTARTARYLTWRYLSPPGVEYEVWAARRGGELVGLMVLNINNGLVPGACAIVDWMVPGLEAEVVDSLIARGVERARDAGRARVLAVFADSSPEFAAMTQRGFAVVPSGQHLERRLTYQIYEHRLSEAFLLEHWWYTLGDSDLA